MDSVTHIFLGAAVAQAVAGRRVGHKYAFFIGALASTFPDFDVFFHTGNQLRDHALHRHFMHSLLIVPLLAALALGPFLLSKKVRPFWGGAYLAALLACMTHTLLDSLTSYGTMIFWPFTERRVALDIVAVVDPFYTVPLIVGVVMAWRRRSPRSVVTALLISTAYLGFAYLQHGRAMAAQAQLIASRVGHHGISGVSVENPRVLPQIGAVISYRSLYVEGEQIYVDALRVPPWGPAVMKAGGLLPRMDVTDLRPFPASAGAAADFDTFAALSNGFVARSPADPLLIGDLRYAFLPEGLEPVWGVQIEETAATQFKIVPRWNYVGRMLRDVVVPRGYGAIPEAGVGK